MVRAAFTDSDGITKGAWNLEEDKKLTAYVLKHGNSKIWNWRLVPECAGLTRSGKSCRLRWLNYLKPGVKRGKFNEFEEDLILKLHAKHGNKWSVISSNLPGRTDNEVKNFWNGHIAKRPSRKSAPGKMNDVHSNGDPSSRVNEVLGKQNSLEMITLPKTTTNESLFYDRSF